MRTVHVVLTTHWDREWVQSFEQFRLRLGELMDRALDLLDAEPETRFVLDGQTIVLDDYLALRPEQAPRLRAALASGRLAAGPWYVLADQFLEGDEAAVRNLLIGRAVARAHGGEPMAEGYVPDSFGSIATLPMLLNGFAIGAANLGRGAVSRPAAARPLFRWAWRDGSEVVALEHGYGSAMGLTYTDAAHWRGSTAPSDPERAAAWAEHRLAQEVARAPAEHVYASAGCDHMPPLPGFARALAAAGERTGARWIASTPQGYFAALGERRDLPRIVGEMRGDRAAPMILQGVLSTDARLKRANRRCEWLLAGALEPLAACARLRDGVDRRPVLRRAWRLLVRNHAHDSICACSVDGVMQDIHVRLRQVGELGELAAQRWLRGVVDQRHGDAPAVALFNGVPGRGPTALDLVVRVPGRLADGGWELRDGAGRAVAHAMPIAYRSIDCETAPALDADLVALHGKTAPADAPPDAVATLLRVHGAIDPRGAAGIARYALAPATARPPLEASARRIANGLIAVEIAGDGRATLTDLRDGRRFADLGWFEDLADAGDTYDHGALAGDRPLRSPEAATVEVRVGRRDAFRAELIATTRWRIPARLDGCGRRERRVGFMRWPAPIEGRRSADGVAIELVSTWTVHAGLDRVEVVTRFANAADQHRLRLAVASPDRPTLTTGAHFAALERAWSEGDDPLPCRPVLDWVHRGDGLAILAPGIYELEPRRVGDGGELLLTLCRSVDTIGPAAGCNYDVEHARALGAHLASYAFAPARAPIDAARAAQAYAAPLVAAGTQRAGGDETIAACADARVLVSALKPAEEGDGVVLRIVNISGATVTTRVTVAARFASARAARLDETPIAAAAPIRGGAVAVSVPAFGTATMILDQPVPRAAQRR